MKVLLKKHQPSMLLLLQEFEEEGFEEQPPPIHKRLLRALSANYPACGLLHPSPGLQVKHYFTILFLIKLIPYLNKCTPPLFLPSAPIGPKGIVIQMPVVRLSVRPSVHQKLCRELFSVTVEPITIIFGRMIDHNDH